MGRTRTSAPSAGVKHYTRPTRQRVQDVAVGRGPVPAGAPGAGLASPLRAHRAPLLERGEGEGGLEVGVRSFVDKGRGG